MGKRIESKPSRTAEWACICRAASSLESSPCFRSDDTLALRILPSPIRYLIQVPLCRRLHCRVGAPRGIYEYLIARTKYMGTVIGKEISGSMDRIVILGAGFDTRAIRFPAASGHTAVYEFDSFRTQQAKLTLCKRNGIPVPPNTIFEAIDIEEEPLSRKPGCTLTPKRHTMSFRQ
jgi:O-methyltransferase involved in polyketide biosynthesis